MDPVTAVGLLLTLVDKVGTLGAMISKAQTEKRDLTQAEVQQLIAADDAARASLQSAIAAAKAQGR